MHNVARYRHIGRTTALLLLMTAVVAGQTPEPVAPDTAMRRLDDRIRALQREAERLAGATRTLVDDLRTLEIERDLRRAEASQAEAAVADAQQALSSTTQRLDVLEQQRVEQLPALRSQLVDLYKHGGLGSARILLGASNLREFGRASRVVAAMADLSRQRIERHRQTLENVRRERAAIEERTRTLAQRNAELQRARATAERAVAAHTARIAEIDSRRDLTARYVGELQVARESLLAQLVNRPGDRAQSAPAVPLAPFRGALEWPVDGRLTGRFGAAANRLGGSAVRNGIEIAAAEGQPVRAVHGGTVVHADPFPGFGTLVILDHGGEQYSLYGYLGAAAVTPGQVVASGAEIGQVGASPAGPAALYFEMRIDGRAVDPVQWLEPR